MATKWESLEMQKCCQIVPLFFTCFFSYREGLMEAKDNDPKFILCFLTFFFNIMTLIT